MKIATAKLSSLSPYSQSRPYENGVPKLEKESAQAYESRTWRNRVHVNADGFIFIPPMAFKICLETAARFLSEKISGRGKATYTKHFLAGVLVTEGPVLPIKADDIPLDASLATDCGCRGEWLYLNADGKKGGNTRVWRCMPKIESWSAIVTFYVLDETITEDVFRRHLTEAGNFIGIGRFAPIRGGFYGRFKVDSLTWTDPQRADSSTSTEARA